MILASLALILCLAIHEGECRKLMLLKLKAIALKKLLIGKGLMGLKVGLLLKKRPELLDHLPTLSLPSLHKPHVVVLHEPYYQPPSYGGYGGY